MAEQEAAPPDTLRPQQTSEDFLFPATWHKNMKL